MEDKEYWFVCSKCFSFTGIRLSAIEKNDGFYCSGCGVFISIKPHPQTPNDTQVQ